MNSREYFKVSTEKVMKSENRAFAREELVYNVTEDLLVILEDKGVSKKELANRLGKSPSFVSQILSGSRNMTLGSLSDICFALGFQPNIVLPVGSAPVEEDLLVEKSNEQSVHEWKNDISVYGDCYETTAEVIANVIDRREPHLWQKVAA